MSRNRSIEKMRDRPWCWEVGVQPGSWGFWKRVSWRVDIGLCRQTIESLPLRHVVGVLQISTDRDRKRYKMCSAFVGSDSMVSIVRIVSLFSCRRTEFKKLIKRLYMNNRVACVFELACVFVLQIYNITSPSSSIKPFSIFAPLSYTAFLQDNICVFYLLGHICEFFSILLRYILCIDCFCMCKWVYLLFPQC